MVDGHDLRAWAPRLLAPIAFFAAATALILLVNSALSSDGGKTAGTTPTTATTTSGETTATGKGETTTAKGDRGGKKKRHGGGGRRSYTIESGDTLASIAEQFDTSVEQLEALNPDVDPAALTVGEKIRVK